MKTYVFPIIVEQDEGENWYAEVPVIPGCALSCYPLEHVLESLQETAQAMLEVMIESRDPLPEGIERYELDSAAQIPSGGEVVTVTLEYP